MLVLDNLLQGTTPTFDAQAIPDATDFAIICAALEGYGVVGNDSNRTAAAVSSLSATNTTLSGSAVALSSLVGAQTLTSSGSFLNLFYPVGGYLSVPTSGGGNALIGYTGLGTNSFTGCFWINGAPGFTGSGNINTGATFTSVYSVQVSDQWLMSAGVPTAVSQVTAGAVGYQPLSLVNSTGTAFQSAPPSAAGDRIDTVVATAAGVVSITQGTPCSTVDWTKNNGSYTNPAPAMAAWASGTPIVLGTIYVPGVGSSHAAATITAGMLTDKTIPIIAPVLNQVSAEISGGADVTINGLVTVISITLPLGTWNLKGGVTVNCVTTGAAFDLEVVAGTAVLGAITGQPSSEVSLVAGNATTMSFDCIVPVTTAGTVLVKVQPSAGTTSLAKKNTAIQGFANATGATAIRVV